MSFVEKLLAERDSLNLSQAQAAAYQNVQDNFSKAWNYRNSQANYTNMSDYLPANKFSVDGGLFIGKKHFKTSAEDKVKNEIEIRDMVKTAYSQLSYALDNPFIKDHLEDNIKELKSNLNEAARTGDYTMVDSFFDSFSNLAKRKSGVSAELINLSSLEKENPAASNARQGGNFVSKVISTIRSLSPMSRT